MSDIHVVKVAKDLEDLIPVFMKNRAKEVDTLRAAVGASDFEQLRQLGHRMKGVGNSYGFAHVSTLGKRIEDAAKADALFTLLMGDDVPPRRQFIEDNALNVQYLDV